MPNQIEIVCKECSSPFKVGLGRIAHTKDIGYKVKFCSNECKQKNRTKRRETVERVCFTCGKKFHIFKSNHDREIKKGNYLGKYCSRQCVYNRAKQPPSISPLHC